MKKFIGFIFVIIKIFFLKKCIIFVILALRQQLNVFLMYALRTPLLLKASTPYDKLAYHVGFIDKVET